MGGARAAALSALQKWNRADAWSDAALNAAIIRGGLDARDAALASRICYGTIQNLLLIDHWLSRCSNRPLNKLEPVVLDILRLSAYQLLLMDRVPAHAVVDEAVTLCKEKGKGRASGFVNAVLRKAASMNREIPDLPAEGTAEYLSIRFSHPLWLCENWIDAHGYAFAEAAVAANNEQPPVCLQCNQLRVDASRLLAELREAGYDVQPHAQLPDAVLCSGGDLAASAPFSNGWFYVQDAAAKCAVLLADPQPGMRVLDACAAPGGKTFSAAVQMCDQGEIVSCDIHENKLKRLRDGAARMGFQSIQTMAMDAREPTLPAESFDVVMADVPCSGLGVIRKKPEIRYKDPKALMALPKIQLDILCGQANMVRPGGVLLYSTCTVERAENEDVVQAFLELHPDFRLEALSLPWLNEPSGMHTFWPHIDGTDGFFVAKMRKLS